MAEAENSNEISEPRHDDGETDVSLLDLLIMLARWKRVILASTLGAATLGAIVALLLPNQYIAEVVLLPPAQNSSTSTAIMNQLGSGTLASLASGSLGIKNPGDMYVSLLRSRTVEDSVIRRFELMARYKSKHMSDARKQLENHAAIALGTKDGLIRISVRDRVPQMAATIANGYVEEYSKLSAQLAVTEAAQRRLFFQKQLEDAKDNLANAEIALKDTEKSTGVLQIDSQAKALIESATSLRAQVAAKQVQLQAMRTFATDDNPAVITAQRELEALQTQLLKLSGTDQEGDSDPVIPKGRIPEAGMEYIRKYRDVRYYETIYGLIARQLEAAKLDEAREGAIIQVVDPAVPPDKKSSPHRGIIVILCLVTGAMTSSVFCLTVEGITRKLEDSTFRVKLNELRRLVRLTDS